MKSNRRSCYCPEKAKKNLNLHNVFFIDSHEPSEKKSYDLVISTQDFFEVKRYLHLP